MGDTPKIVIPKEGESLYDQLQKRALDYVQQLSGKVWTDYNPHDPGVTTLDIVNYALTELDFRLNFPLEEYLAAPNQYFHPEQYGLFGPEKVFSMNPVTPEDYRNLILDTLETVEDVQLKIHEPENHPSECYGWYDLSIELSPYLDARKIADEENNIRAAIQQLYHSHRNLGENLCRIAFIKREKLILTGAIHTDGTTQPEDLLATIYIEALKLFAPGTHYSKNTLPVYNLYKQIKRLPGIAAIRSLDFKGDEVKVASYTLAISNAEDIQVTLFRNDEPVHVNINQVLRRLYASTNIRHAIRSKQKKEIQVPVFKSRYHPFSHYSIQNDFPACYAVNRQGPALSEGEHRRVQIRQFKAYLLLFDLFLAQGLEEINDLPSWMLLDTKLPADRIPTLESPEYLWDLLIDPKAFTPNQPEREKSQHENKDRLLDTLDKMYGENSNLPFMRLPNPEANRQRRVNFLRQLPHLIQNRHTGINLQDASSVSGLEQYITTLLGLDQTGDAVYAIEHLLLHSPEESDPERENPDDNPSEKRKGARLPLEFALTIVMPRNERSDERPEFRLRIEEFLCERVPAHIQFSLCWLAPGEMELFRKHYTAWRIAWSNGDKEAIDWTTGILLSGLIQIRNRTQK